MIIATRSEIVGPTRKWALCVFLVFLFASQATSPSPSGRRKKISTSGEKAQPLKKLTVEEVFWTDSAAGYGWIWLDDSGKLVQKWLVRHCQVGEWIEPAQIDPKVVAIAWWLISCVQLAGLSGHDYEFLHDQQGTAKAILLGRLETLQHAHGAEKNIALGR